MQIEWYATRSRLAFAYATSGKCLFFLYASIRLHFTELVYAMQSNSSTDDAMNLLKRIAHTPGAYNFGTRSLASALQWAEWGGRGWLGMYFKMIDLERHLAKLESMTRQVPGAYKICAMACPSGSVRT